MQKIVNGLFCQKTKEAQVADFTDLSQVLQRPVQWINKYLPASLSAFYLKGVLVTYPLDKELPALWTAKNEAFGQ